MPEGKLVLIIGPAGVGKRTLISYILSHLDDTAFSVSATTRQPRSNEVAEVDYYFISRDEFEQRIRESRFLEFAEYAGNYYGTPRDAVLEKLRGGITVLVELEVRGAKQIIERMREAVSIFIAPPEPALETLCARLTKRKLETGEKTDVAKRLRIAEEELAQKDDFDVVIVNDDLHVAQRELLAYIIGHMGVEP